ncbi:MAG: hypothetical protein RIC16_09585 [Rhodospirillales bacterium]
MEQYLNFVIMGVIGLFAIAFGIWFNWKMGAKKRAARKAEARKRAAALAAQQRDAGGSDDFEEEFLSAEDNSLPDDDDGEFKDTNLFGMKRRKDGPDVYRDWD